MTRPKYCRRETRQINDSLSIAKSQQKQLTSSQLQQVLQKTSQLLADSSW